MTPRMKSLLIYDGGCPFCRLWIDRWKWLTGDSVEYATAADAAPDHPSIPPGAFARSVVLVHPDGSYVTGALAALTVLGSSSAGRALLMLYRNLPGFRAAAEGLYTMVAAHRDEMHLLTRVLWGRSTVPPGYAATRWLFVRGMAVIYGVAFGSLSAQITGLVGSDGISPVELFLAAVHAQIGDSGPLYYPTFAWIDAGDGLLTGLCAAGMISAGLLFVGVLPRVAALLCWLLYFSLVVAGQVFLQFQWDVLLLEAGFLTIFFAPPGLLRILPGGLQPPRALRWLLWFLVFRLMFMSGALKLTAGDPNWWNLTALSFHYQTQCLPNPVAWYAHGLPVWFHQCSAFVMFTIEIGAPFLIAAPRRLRHLGAFLLIGLQALIMLTGNFAFFNWLAVVLCLSLLDDGVTRRFMPKVFFPRPSPRPWSAASPGAGAGRPARFRAGVARVIGVTLASLMVVLNANQIAGLAVPRAWWPGPLASFSGWAAHFHIVNGYGLFRVMTTKRPEIVLEGSDDRVNWKPYEFRYKPGDVTRPPPWVAPHQPRLDWQMWFAALGDYGSNGWVVNLAIRLMEGSPPVLGLFEGNPFPGAPPRYVRGLLYEYRFTTPAERDSTGAYWRRTLNSIYLPPFSLDDR